MFPEIHVLSIIVAGILAGAIGSIWYSPVLFAAAWTKSLGIPFGEDNIPKNELLIAAVRSVCGHILFFFLVAQSIPFIREGLVSFFEISGIIIGLLGVQLLSPIIWEKKPMTYFWIHFGYTAIIVCMGLATMLYWPW